MRINVGAEFYYDRSLGLPERWYCMLFGIPIIGLRIRLRRLNQILPASATRILDAGCGRGVISRELAKTYPNAVVYALDSNPEAQINNEALARSVGITNCYFVVRDLNDLQENNSYDLIVSIDNLEHIEDDESLLGRLFESALPGGVLIIHVPHYYRRWPVLKWGINFDVPGHMRPGYHQPEIVERVRKAGFTINSTGFSYGFLENLVNNFGYWITGAEERNRIVYGLFFPLLNFIAWLGAKSKPTKGAGVWVVAVKPLLSMPQVYENEVDLV